MEIKAFDEIEALEQKAEKIIKNIHDAKIRYMNGDKNAGKDALWQVYKWVCSKCGWWIEVNNRQYLKRMKSNHKETCEARA